MGISVQGSVRNIFFQDLKNASKTKTWYAKAFRVCAVQKGRLTLTSPTFLLGCSFPILFLQKGLFCFVYLRVPGA